MAFEERALRAADAEAPELLSYELPAKDTLARTSAMRYGNVKASLAEFALGQQVCVCVCVCVSVCVCVCLSVCVVYLAFRCVT